MIRLVFSERSDVEMNNSAAMSTLPPLRTCACNSQLIQQRSRLSLICYPPNTTTSWKVSACRLRIICRDASKPAGKLKKDKYKKNKSTTDDDHDEVRERADQVQPSPSVDSVIKKRLDDVNPVGLGRHSRQIFDEVRLKFAGLGQISRTARADDATSLLAGESGPMCEFATPGAQNTTVLVVGATSRVGYMLSASSC